MRALVLDESKQLSISDVESPSPKAGEVLVKVRAAALNHRELWIVGGQYPGMKLPSTLGADGAGTVVGVGQEVDPEFLGRDVICYPALGWGDDEEAPGPAFRLFGMPENGFIAEEICIPAENALPKPAHLSWAEAAALPVAGLTAWRALVRHAQAGPEQKILVTGIGGGVAQSALMFAKKLGASVYVTSSSEEKLAQAIAMGATGGVNYTKEGWEGDLKKLSGGIDAVIDGAPPAHLSNYMRFLKTGAKIIIYGIAKNETATFSCSHLFLRHFSVIGTSMGSLLEFKEMLAFIEQHQIRPLIYKTFSFDQAIEALKALSSSTHAGKIVVEGANQ